MIRNDLKRFQKIAMNSTFTKTLDCMYKVEISKENLKTVDLKNHSVHDHLMMQLSNDTSKNSTSPPYLVKNERSLTKRAAFV